MRVFALLLQAQVTSYKDAVKAASTHASLTAKKLAPQMAQLVTQVSSVSCGVPGQAGPSAGLDFVCCWLSLTHIHLQVSALCCLHLSPCVNVAATRTASSWKRSQPSSLPSLPSSNSAVQHQQTTAAAACWRFRCCRWNLRSSCRRMRTTCMPQPSSQPPW